MLSHVENQRQLPSLALLFRYEVLFGRSGRELFPDLYASVAERTRDAAAAMLAAIHGEEGSLAERQREFLQHVLQREPQLGSPAPLLPPEASRRTV